MKSLVVIAALLALLAACNREGDGGPAERAGRQVDKALDKAGKAVEQAGKDMQDSSKGKK